MPVDSATLVDGSRSMGVAVEVGTITVFSSTIVRGDFGRSF